MSLVYFQAHYFYFAGFAAITAFSISLLMDNFHKGDPTLDSFFYTKDEPIANKFIFAYGLASIPFAYFITFMVILSVHFFVYGIQVIFFKINLLLGNGVSNIVLLNMDMYYDIISPWQVGGGIIGEIIGFALAGFRMGYYSEEKSWKVYINPLLVFLTYSLLSLWGIVGLDSNPNKSIFFFSELGLSEILYLLLIDLILLLTMTWVGNVKSIDSEHLENAIDLPTVNSLFRAIYILSIISLFINIVLSTFLLISNRGFYYYEIVLFTGNFIIIATIFSYAIYSLVIGDTSRTILVLTGENRIIEIAEDDDMIDSKIISKVIFVVSVLTISLLYYTYLFT